MCDFICNSIAVVCLYVLVSFLVGTIFFIWVFPYTKDGKEYSAEVAVYRWLPYSPVEGTNNFILNKYMVSIFRDEGIVYLDLDEEEWVNRFKFKNDVIGKFCYRIIKDPEIPDRIFSRSNNLTPMVLCHEYAHFLNIRKGLSLPDGVEEEEAIDAIGRLFLVLLFDVQSQRLAFDRLKLGLEDATGVEIEKTIWGKETTRWSNTISELKKYGFQKGYFSVPISLY